jgi:hypothetical protein
MHLNMRLLLVIVAFATFHLTSHAWKPLAPGLELGIFGASRSNEIGDAKITILRIDPQLWELEFAGASQNQEEQQLHTAREWCEERGFVVAINAGMFQTDYLSNVGYLKAGDHLNNPGVNHYLSVAAFDPVVEGLPPFRIFDLDYLAITMEQIIGDYETVIQNLRLIKRAGENRWRQQSKIWSEVALGEDIDGNILFISCRSPYSMHDLNEELLQLGIGLVCAQHLEGGPEAQLYIKVDELEQQLVGSYETNFYERDDNHTPSRIPNVIGVKKRE